MSNCFPLRVRVLKGKRAYGVESSSTQRWVKMTPEPFESTEMMITVIYEIEGLAVYKHSFKCFDAKGEEIAVGGSHSFTTTSYGFMAGYQVKNTPLEKIGHIELSIGDAD